MDIFTKPTRTNNALSNRLPIVGFLTQFAKGIIYIYVKFIKRSEHIIIFCELNDKFSISSTNVDHDHILSFIFNDFI